MEENIITDSGEQRLRVRSPEFDPLPGARAAVESATRWAFANQKPDGHWYAELESNHTITAEYVFMRQALELGIEKERGEKIKRAFFGDQKPDGSWGIAYNHRGDVSTTAEVYLALRILGVETTDERMKRAEEFIVSNGGLEKIRVFTRINFAMFGLFPWDAVPVVPPEFILVPSSSPVNIYRLSSWARGTMVPLFIIFHHKPIFALPNGQGKSENNTWLDHLWKNAADKHVAYMPSLSKTIKEHGVSWKTVFSLTDPVLKRFDRRKIGTLREIALKRCEEWVLEHQEETGDWAGIFPPMVNGVLALALQGLPLKSGPVKLGLDAIERFAIDDERGFRVQACVSPVWDTILMMIGVLDGGFDQNDARLAQARDWIVREQILVDHGDWKVYNPKGRPGGWAFEYKNTWYPDVDDTAAVVIGLLKQNPLAGKTTTVQAACDWIASMQNRDGGWAAFDINNDKLYLNDIPFSDMDSLCDNSSPDVTGRVLEAFGILQDARFDEACRKGIEYLKRSQEPQGSWFGRWGVNYVYGTSNVLCALKRQGLSDATPMIQRALRWLKSTQNQDGGWGECLESYSDKNLMGKGESTASQTAWALMGLLAYLPASNSAIQAGVCYLIEHQRDGTWDEKQFTGTGFPNHFYLRYHMYRHYFPMMALGRYISQAG